MAVRQLSVVLDLDTGRAEAKLKSTGNAFKTLGLDTKRAGDNVHQMGRSFDNLNKQIHTPLAKLRDYVMILGNLRFALMNVRDIAIGWVVGLMKQAGEVERLTILMKGMSKAQTEVGRNLEAQKNLRELIDLSRNTGFELKTLADGFVKFQSADLNPQVHQLRGLTEAVARFGGDSDIMHRASIAIQQMAGKGKISMEELRQQLGEAVPTAMRIMANSLGMTVGKLGDEIKKGHVAAKPALELMLRDMEMQFAGSGQKLADSLFGQIAQVKTNMLVLSTDFSQMGNENGLFATSLNSLKELNELMKSGEGRAAMRDLGNSVATVANALATGVKFIIRWRSEIGAFIGTIVTVFGAMKAIQLGSWFAELAITASQAFRNISAGSQNLTGVTGDIARWGDTLRKSVDDVRASTAQSIPIYSQELQQSRQFLASSRSKVSALQAERAALTANLAAAHRNVDATAQSLAIGRQSGQWRDAMTGKWSSETAVINANTTAINRQNAIKRMLIGVDAQLAVAENTVTVAQNAATAATTRLTVAERAATMSKTLMAGAARYAGASVAFMGRMMNIALGPIGMVGLALYTAAQYAGLFSSKADDAAAAADRLRTSMASLADVKEVQAGIDEIDRKLQFNRFRVDLFNPGGVTRENEALLKRRADLTKRITEGRPTAMGNEGSALADRARTERQAQMDILRGRRNFAGESARLEVEIAAGGTRAVAATRRLNQIRDAEAVAEKRILTNQIKNASDRLKVARDANDEGGIRKYTAALTQVTADLEAVNQKGLSANLQLEALSGEGKDGKNGKGAAGAIRRTANNVANLKGEIAGLQAQTAGDKSVNLIKFMETLNAGGFQGKSPAEIELMRRKAALKDALADSKGTLAGENSYESKLASMSGRLAELNDELIGGTGNLAKFNAQLDAGKFENLSDAQIEKLRSVAVALDEAEQKLRIKDLDKELTKATAEADAMWGSFNTGALVAQKRIAGLRAQFEDKLIGLSGQDLVEAEAKINKIVDALQRAEAAKTAFDWSQEALAARDDMMSENAAREAQFQRELERRRIIVESYKQGTEERQRIEESFNRWQIAERQRVNRANESSTTKMARDWALLGQRIDQAMGQALGSFIDQMFEGKMAFGDFAKSLLKQLLKIIIQAMIAYAVLAALGMTNNAAGQNVGFGSFMKGQIGAGFGMGGSADTEIGFAGTHHTGGIVGHADAFKMVSSAMFDNAKKYHGGGMISKLGPKEVPMIGLEGERVLTEEDQADLAASRGGKMPNVQVNVINNSDTQLTAETSEPTFDGKGMVLSVVMEAASKQGPFRDMLSAAAKGTGNNG